MGFLDNLFGGKAQSEAAILSRDYLQNTQNKSLDYLKNAQTQGLDYLNQGYSAGQDALTRANAQGTRDINSGSNAALNDISSGSSNALGRIDAAGRPLSSLGDKYGGATSLALDALGVNGAGGNTRAQDAFTTSPGYNFNLNQGLDAINRARAASGQLAGGNTDRSVQEYGAGLASNEYNNWLNSLLGFTKPELSATTGAANIGAKGADIANQAGINSGNIDLNRTKMLANIANTYGINSSNLATAKGRSLADIVGNTARSNVGVLGNYAGPYVNTFGNEAAAQTAGSANLFNLGMEGAKAAIGFL